MWMPSDEKYEADLNRRCIGDQIDRDPVGRKLTPEARESAITTGVNAWKGARTGCGDAARVGIQEVTGKILKR